MHRSVLSALLLGLVAVPLVAAAPVGPDRATLQLTTEVVPVPGGGLMTDTASDTTGDKVAGNGVPDGWRGNFREGTLQIAAGAPYGKGGSAQITYAGRVMGSLVAPHAPAVAGDTYVLRTAFDGGKAPAQHGASLGIVFLQGERLTGWAFHRVETEVGGWQDVEVRATAPAGTDRVAARWVVDTAQASAGTFGVAPIRLERMSARSVTRDFPVERVYLVTIETFRHDHASLYGYARDTTPNLKRIAEGGARFDRHYVQAPYTRPSLSSLVTSRYPTSLGIVENIPPLPQSVRTVAEMFADGGYVTGGFLAQFLLSHTYGFQQGFHYFYNYENDTPAETVTRDLWPWLERFGDDNAFVWAHLFDPHGPYRPVEGWDPGYRGDALWAADGAQLDHGKERFTGPYVPGYVYDEGQVERRHYVANYDAEIAYVDRELGRLMDVIEKSGKADRTLLVVTADHGESMTDHGRYFAHGSIYEHDLRVPMIVWGPGRVPAGTIVTERTHHLDIVPTLLDYAGVKAPANLKGRSLRPVIDGKAKSTLAWSVAVTGAGKDERVAIVGDGRLKVVVDGKHVPVEAYDLGADPAELHDVLGERRAEADAVVAAWTPWMAAQLKDDAPKPAKKQERKPQGEELEQLRALGYIE